jgi:ribosomal protein S27AE
VLTRCQRLAIDNLENRSWKLQNTDPAIFFCFYAYSDSAGFREGVGKNFKLFSIKSDERGSCIAKMLHSCADFGQQWSCTVAGHNYRLYAPDYQSTSCHISPSVGGNASNFHLFRHPTYETQFSSHPGDTMKNIRCPYCVEGNFFKEMVSHLDGRFICRKCGHVVRPGDPDFKCVCAKCAN